MLACIYNTTDVSVIASFCNSVIQNVIILKMTSMINKLADWPPNYHKVVGTFPKSPHPHSMNKLTLNVTPKKYTYDDE